jgi:putative tryptophan/tyrosine transport system substrate-binding protein
MRRREFISLVGGCGGDCILLRVRASANLPIQQPTKYDLAITMNIAKSLGLDLPPMLLAAVHEIIE